MPFADRLWRRQAGGFPLQRPLVISIHALRAADLIGATLAWA